jgi:hypothetical protein
MVELSYMTFSGQERVWWCSVLPILSSFIPINSFHMETEASWGDTVSRAAITSTPWKSETTYARGISSLCVSSFLPHGESEDCALSSYIIFYPRIWRMNGEQETLIIKDHHVNVEQEAQEPSKHKDLRVWDWDAWESPLGTCIYLSEISGTGRGGIPALHRYFDKTILDCI